MAYVKTIWKDRTVEKPRNYTMADNADGTITLTPSPGVVTEAGTPIIAANLNNIEDTLEAHDTDLAAKVNQANIIQTTEVNDSTKIPSSAVTYGLKQSINAIFTAKGANCTRAFDFNTYKTSGLYPYNTWTGTGGSNYPPTQDTGFMLVLANTDSSNVAQIVIGTVGKIYIRSCASSVWESSWKTVTVA